MSIADRIIQTMNHYRLNKTELSSRLGLSPAVLSHITSGRNKPSLELITQILQTFPEISSDWLILGKGGMLRDNSQSGNTELLHKLIEEAMLLNRMNHNNMGELIENIKKAVKL